MLRVAVALTLPLCFVACAAPSVYAPGAAASPAYTLAKTPATGPVVGRPTWGPPVALPGASTRILPFSHEEKVGWFSDPDAFDEGGLATLGSGPSASEGSTRRTASGALRWHNAVVIDLQAGEQWPLLERRGVLSRLWMRVDGEGADARCSALVFAATVEDSNGDGVLDDRDAIRALATSGDGREPRFVSPAGTQLRSVVFDGDLDVAVLMIARDLDGDGAFGSEESPEPFLLDLSSVGEAAPLVRNDTRASLEAWMGG